MTTHISTHIPHISIGRNFGRWALAGAAVLAATAALSLAGSRSDSGPGTTASVEPTAAISGGVLPQVGRPDGFFVAPSIDSPAASAASTAGAVQLQSGRPDGYFVAPTGDGTAAETVSCDTNPYC